MSRITLHGPRCTHATLFLEIGEHPRVVQVRLGHATAGMTLDAYSHVTPTMQRAAIDNLAEALKRANETRSCIEPCMQPFRLVISAERSQIKR
mgnify:CR=1 FL=1